MPANYAHDVFVKTFGRAPAQPRPAAAAKDAPAETPSDRLARAPKREADGRVIYHVTPRAHDARWNVKARGIEDPIAVLENKDEAVERAKELAKRHEWSQVIVHNQDGKIAHEFVYGAPPEDQDDGPDETDVPDGETQQSTSAPAKPTGKVATPPAAPDRMIYHVMPRKNDGRWNVLKQGRSKPNRVLETQAEAIEFAMALARTDRNSWVITHAEDGAILEEIHVTPV